MTKPNAKPRKPIDVETWAIVDGGGYPVELYMRRRDARTMACPDLEDRIVRVRVTEVRAKRRKGRVSQ